MCLPCCGIAPSLGIVMLEIEPSLGLTVFWFLKFVCPLNIYESICPMNTFLFSKDLSSEQLNIAHEKENEKTSPSCFCFLFFITLVLETDFKT